MEGSDYNNDAIKTAMHNSCLVLIGISELYIRSQRWSIVTLSLNWLLARMPPAANEKKSVGRSVKLSRFWWKYLCQHFSIVLFLEKKKLISLGQLMPIAVCPNSTTMEKCWHVYFHQKRESFTLLPTLLSWAPDATYDDIASTISYFMYYSLG